MLNIQMKCLLSKEQIWFAEQLADKVLSEVESESDVDIEPTGSNDPQLMYWSRPWYKLGQYVENA
mgnify:CR=1 FL=1